MLTADELDRLLADHVPGPRPRVCRCGQALRAEGAEFDAARTHQAEVIAGQLVARRAAQAAANLATRRGHHTRAAAELTLADLGLLVRPPGGAGWALLLGVDPRPSADGGTVVTLDLLPDAGGETEHRTLAGRELVEVYR